MKRLGGVIGLLLFLGIPLAILAQQPGYKTFGLISPRGYEAKLTAGGALQLTTATPGSPPQTTTPASPFDRFQFAWSQLPDNQLQVNADGKIHVTIDGVVGGTSAWGGITGTLSDQTDLQAALDAKQATLGNAAADGATLGKAAFTAADFDAASGVISIDYTNGQAAASGVKGFLTAADWATFNAKQATMTAGAGLGLSGVTLSTASQETGFLADGGSTSLTCGSSAQGQMQVMDSGALEFCDGAGTSVLRSVGPGVMTQTGLTWNVTAATCTGDANVGKLTVNGSSEIVCASDIGGAGGASDITAVGSCLTNDCFTAGAPSASLVFNNATSGTVTLQAVAGALGARTLSMPAETGTVCTTGSVCSGYQATLGNAAADGATLGKVAFVAADMNCTAGVCGIDYTNAQAAASGVKGFLTAADWATFNAKQAAGSYATLTGVETLTNKRIQPVLTTVASNVSFACNVDNATDCSMQMTGASGTVTFAAPGGAPTPMQRILYRLKCTNSQTYAFATGSGGFRFSATIIAPVTCAAGKTDYVGAIYNDIESKWDVLAVDQGH